MNDEKLREAYERGLPRGARQAPLDDLAAERLRRLVEQEGSDAERLHTVEELLTSAEGRQDLEIAWAAARASRLRGRMASRWRSLAAALLVAIGMSASWFVTRDADDVPRGDASPVDLVAPLGAQPGPSARHFTWHRVDRAVGYTLVVVDTAGNEVFAAETADTALTLPDSVSLVPQAYLWWVQARRPLGDMVTAVTARFEVIAR